MNGGSTNGNQDRATPCHIGRTGPWWEPAVRCDADNNSTRAMGGSMSSRRRSTAVAAAFALAVSGVALTAGAGQANPGRTGTVQVTAATQSGSSTDKAVFFASDGLRQDLVEKYADKGLMPTMASFLRKGTRAKGDGMLTQAPPNTGAGWYTLATGAWPGVHGSTNNTFHKNGDVFTNRTAAFDSGVLQAETIAQAAERGGLKVAQVEWAGGRNATISGPTIDYQTFHSGRGVATNFIGGPGDALFDDANFIAAFGLQFDHPAGHAGQAPFPQAAPSAATGWTDVPASFSPAQEMRLRVLDGGVDKYGLNAYLYDSTDDATVNYDRVLFSPTKSGTDAVGDLAEGEWADVKVTLAGRRPGRQDRRHAGQGRGALRRPVPGAAVPHLGDPGDRQLADLAGRAGLHRRSTSSSPRSSPPRRPPTSRSSRRASSARTPTSSRASTGPRATGR